MFPWFPERRQASFEGNQSLDRTIWERFDESTDDRVKSAGQIPGKCAKEI